MEIGTKSFNVFSMLLGSRKNHSLETLLLTNTNKLQLHVIKYMYRADIE